MGLPSCLPTRKDDYLTSVWKVLSATVLRSLAWILQVVTCARERSGLENSDSFFVVFYLKAGVGAAVVGNIFLQLWVVPGTSFGSHVDLTFMNCVLYSALAGKRAELNPPQSIGRSLEQRAFPAYLSSSLMDLQSQGCRRETRRDAEGHGLSELRPCTCGSNWVSVSDPTLAYPSQPNDEEETVRREASQMRDPTGCTPCQAGGPSVSCFSTGHQLAHAGQNCTAGIHTDEALQERVSDLWILWLSGYSDVY